MRSAPDQIAVSSSASVLSGLAAGRRRTQELRRELRSVMLTTVPCLIVVTVPSFPVRVSIRQRLGPTSRWRSPTAARLNTCDDRPRPAWRRVVLGR